MILHSVRHGQTEFNAAKKWQGWMDSPLTELGRQQARETALRLKGIAFDKIVVSPLGRAQQTLDEFLKVFPDWKNIPIQIEEQIKERNVGHVAGIPFPEVLERFPEEMELRRTDPMAWEPKGGETSLEFVNRIREWAQKFAKDHQGQSVLKISHGGVCGQLHAFALGLPPKEGWSFKIPNACLSVYEVKDKDWSLVETNLVAVDFHSTQRIT